MLDRSLSIGSYYKTDLSFVPRYVICAARAGARRRSATVSAMASDCLAGGFASVRNCARSSGSSVRFPTVRSVCSGKKAPSIPAVIYCSNAVLMELHCLKHDSPKARVDGEDAHF